MDFQEKLNSTLKETSHEGIEYILHVHERFEKLESRIIDLESKLNLNNSNRGKPPYSIAL
ncbi:hypothetical protein DLD82_16780 [Methanospirillum stamsii]|uniref:Uncharacterized protein n=1 Tax=Methanospirillum stamsii TaxID=1277351 RepID=A0A2V2MZZ3_9EURY|nr:hypothetical protein DLD82_16780 [Methanospirillum stamsii]